MCVYPLPTRRFILSVKHLDVVGVVKVNFFPDALQTRDESLRTDQTFVAAARLVKFKE